MNNWRQIRRILLPPARCLLCAAAALRGNLCGGCIADLPILGNHCSGCANPLAIAQRHCGHCLNQTVAYEQAHAAMLYEFPVNWLIRRLKFSGRLDVAFGLGELCATVLAKQPHARFDGIVPIPLHWRRQWRRGFNQAHELARPLARRVKLPLLGDILRRPRATRAQSGLSQADRDANIHGALHCITALKGQRLILFDDVMTTGATVGAAAAALKRAGAAEVCVWCCARA